MFPSSIPVFLIVIAILPKTGTFVSFWGSDAEMKRFYRNTDKKVKRLLFMWYTYSQINQKE
jgi:hypothetical protein